MVVLWWPVSNEVKGLCSGLRPTLVDISTFGPGNYLPLYYPGSDTFILIQST